MNNKQRAEEEYSVAFIEGFFAQGDGFKQSGKNPYRKGSDEYRDWDRGYSRAEKARKFSTTP